MTRTEKVRGRLDTQLGVRVRRETRERATAAARLASVSLNRWVDDLICSVAGNISGPIVPTPGQMGIDMDTVLEDMREVSEAGAFAITKTLIITTVPFDPSCSNGTYHWKHSPGSPCRRCGGEV